MLNLTLSASLSYRVSQGKRLGHWHCCLLLLLLLVNSAVARTESAFTVDFLTPSTPDSPFYMTLCKIMQAAADDLNINLKIAYGQSSSIKAKHSGLEMLKFNEPDHFLTGYYLDVTQSHLEFTAKNKTKVFMITAQPPERESTMVGKPRQKYTQWIGQLTPDEKLTGYLLADKLIVSANKAGLVDSDGKVHVIALGGHHEDYVSELRIKGLNERIKAGKDAILRTLS